MQLVVLGAGAIGSLIGGLLAEVGHDVTLIGRPYHVRAIRSQGLRISGVTGGKTVKVKAVVRPSDIGGEADIILCTVKAYDTKQAAIDAKPLIGKQSLFLLMQNGLEVEKGATEVLGEMNVSRGVTNNGALFVKPGYIRHTGLGDTLIGCADDHWQDKIGKLVEALNASGLPATLTKNISEVVWSKALVNVGINAIGAITRLRNGALLLDQDLKGLMRSAIEEGLRVADKSGMRIKKEDIVEKTFKIAEATARNKNSMLQDVERGRRTEIDFINGAIIRIGKRCGIPTPVNDTLTALVKAIEQGTMSTVHRRR